jgi:hypothetical protein
VADTVVVRSLGELVDHATPDEPDPAIGRRRDSAVYRGVGDASWPMLTSLDRLGGTNPPHAKRGLEEHVLRNFARYSRPYLGAPGASAARGDWELLAAAQHHGVPTRLLDWTYSPLVAAHFATLGRRGDAGAQGGGAEGADRVIFRFDWHRVHRHFGLPARALLAEDLEAIREVPGGAPGQPFTPWALAAHGDAVAPFACVFEPPTLDARIAAQAAVLTLMHTTACAFDTFLADHGLTASLTRYVIPGEAVARVRDQLDLASFDERRLFPDLDGVAARLRRYYS